MASVEIDEGVRDADLTPRLRAAVEAAKRGKVVPIEREGHVDAAIVDLTDYRLLRAFARCQSEPLSPDLELALWDGDVAGLNLDELYYRVLASYTPEAGRVSLGWVAERLDMPWIEVRERFNRLGIPMYFGPATVEELREEVEVAMRIGRSRPS